VIVTLAMQDTAPAAMALAAAAVGVLLCLFVELDVVCVWQTVHVPSRLPTLHMLSLLLLAPDPFSGIAITQISEQQQQQQQQHNPSAGCAATCRIGARWLLKCQQTPPDQCCNGKRCGGAWGILIVTHTPGC
jgi:hypothetical protein